MHVQILFLSVIIVGYRLTKKLSGPRPKPSALIHYLPIILEGHISQRFVTDISTFSNLMELLWRPELSKNDKEEVGKLALSFFNHLEKDYYQIDPERIGLCKTNIHLILHVEDNIENCGPLINCSQFYVERYIGFIKNRLNARTPAAESLLENAKLLEGYKLFYGHHFFKKEGLERDIELENGTIAPIINEEITASDPDDEYLLVSPRRSDCITSLENRRLKLGSLLKTFIMLEENLTSEQATVATQALTFTQWSAIKVRCGQEWLKIGGYTGLPTRDPELIISLRLSLVKANHPPLTTAEQYTTGR